MYKEYIKELIYLIKTVNTCRSGFRYMYLFLFGDILDMFCTLSIFKPAGPMSSVGTSVRGPESQDRARESLMGSIALAIDVLFCFFHI